LTQQEPQSPPATDGAPLEPYKQARRIFAMARKQGLFSGEGVKARAPRECAESLLLRLKQKRTPELQDALSGEIRDALRDGVLVTKKGCYRLPVGPPVSRTLTSPKYNVSDLRR